MDCRLDKDAHSVYVLHYHLVQRVKYRRGVFVDDRYVDLLKTKIHSISETFGVEVTNIECSPDHFHMLFKAGPTLNLPKYINALKTVNGGTPPRSNKCSGVMPSGHDPISLQPPDRSRWTF